MDHQLQKLKTLIENYDYCTDVQRDSFNRLVVYTNDMKTAMVSLPDYIDNEQVLVHFASSMDLGDKYRKTLSSDKEEDLSMELLAKELEKMSQSCTWEVLTAIFFEVHDKENAVSGYSKAFSSTYKSMERLYNLYGYDVLAEELRIN